MSRPTYIIVIGASEGGLDALSTLASNFTEEMDAAVLVVMHTPSSSVSNYLLQRLEKVTSFKTAIAEDKMQLRKGHIYIAATNMHLLVEEKTLRLGRGPEEGYWRPSVNALFRSAAAAWANAVIGVVLTGLLDDGATGMQDIRKSGGICIIQEPDEAEYPEMPLAVLNLMQPDYVLRLPALAGTLARITSKRPPSRTDAPETLKTEANIALDAVIGYDNVGKIGQTSPLACPICGGVLYVINEAKEDRYRCHIGHSFTEKELLLRQDQSFESVLWVALRTIQERKTLLNNLETRSNERGLTITAEAYRAQAEIIDQHITKLKDVLFTNQDLKNNHS